MKRKFYRIRHRDLTLKVQISKANPLHDVISKYLSTGEMPPMMSEPSDSYDFQKAEDVDFDKECRTTADLSDMVSGRTLQETVRQTPSEPAGAGEAGPKGEASPETGEAGAPDSNSTNGAD